MKEGQTAAPSADRQRIRSFLAAAFSDYIAARVLLNNSLPLQGAIQASTALEKYLKAFLAFRGDKTSRGHLQRAQMNALKNFAPELWATFNEEFFLLCQKVYDLRYPDSLPAGYNVVIASREFLAELDDTAIALHGTFILHDADGQQQRTAMETFLDRRDPRLIFKNHLLFRKDKQEFIASAPQAVYEARVIPEEGGLVAVEYIAHPCASDGHFLREGARPDGKHSVLLALKLLRETDGTEHPGAPSAAEVDATTALANESEKLTNVLANRVLARAVRHSTEELMLEFADRTRLYVDGGEALECSITADDECGEHDPVLTSR